MRRRGFLLVLASWALSGAGGCAHPPAYPPDTLTALEAHHRSGKQEFPNRMIALHNARRVVSGELPAPARLESLKVLEKVDTPEAETYPALAAVLADADAPKPVRMAVLAFLARKGYPGLADQVASALPQAGDEQLRWALLEWVEAHPGTGGLADIVKLWAAEKTRNEDIEVRYRRIIEKMTGKNWDQALLDGLNAADFAARGSAVEVLTARLKPEPLRQKILGMRAASATMGSLQYLADAFAYTPHTRRELLACVTIYGGSGDVLRRAADLAEGWRADGYQFNIRDCHLLGHLAADPLRKRLSRQTLLLENSRAIASRRGLAPGPAGSQASKQHNFRRGRLVDFDSQAESLSVADLWNIHLLSEMLARPRVGDALRVMAEKDRADKQTQWGGLISYEQGQAEAKLYPPAARRGDDQYVPGETMLRDALDSLCWFAGHFDRDADNPDGVGPTKAELDFSRDWNLSGLVLTSLAGGAISAMYLNPDGAVIDLGEFPTK